MANTLVRQTSRSQTTDDAARSGYARCWQRKHSPSFLSALCCVRGRPASWQVSVPGPSSTATLWSGITVQYEGLTPKQISETAPGWLIFRDGCPGGEAPEQVGDRVDQVIARVRAEGDCALFAHGHVLRVLGARWLGFPVGAGQHFALSTGTISVLGYYHDIPAIKIWNWPAGGTRSRADERYSGETTPDSAGRTSP